jgi:glutathione S-transferase
LRLPLQNLSILAFNLLLILPEYFSFYLLQPCFQNNSITHAIDHHDGTKILFVTVINKEMNVDPRLFSEDKNPIFLYGDPASVFVRKVRILLVEKKIPFIPIVYNPLVEHSPEFLAMNPLNKIPVLKQGSYTLADSSAICAYLDKKYPTPAFYPQEVEAYGKVLSYEEYADTALFNALAPCYFQKVLVPLYRERLPDEQAIEDSLKVKLPPICDYLENELKGKTYLVDHQFTVADVAIASMFLNTFASGFPLPTNKWPLLNHYLQSIFNRQSFKDCVPAVNAVVEEGKKAVLALTEKNKYTLRV